MLKRNHILTAVVAAVLVCLTGIPAVAAITHVDTIERDIKVGAARAIIVEGVNGNITITGEKGREEIFLKVIKSVYTESEKEADQIASLMEIEISGSEDILKIKTLYPKKFKVRRNIISMVIGRGPKMMMELSLLVPKELEVAVSTARGSITVVDMESSVKASTSSGEVDLRNIGGNVEVSVSSGEIEVVNISGDAFLKAASGTIIAKNVDGDIKSDVTSGKMKLLQLRGNLECSIGYGSVIVEGVGGVEYRGINADANLVDVRGSVDASTASGDICIRATPEGDMNYKITASSGDISLRFLAVVEGGYVLKVGTTSGAISVDLPLDLKKVARNSIYGTVRDGKAKVFLETASGDITVEEPGE